jgi:hypothetical protein
MSPSDFVRKGLKLCAATAAVVVLGMTLGVISLKAPSPFTSVYAVSGPRPDRLVRRANILDELRVQHNHARTSANIAKQFGRKMSNPKNLFSRNP